jgi:hypothetical protein
LEQSKGEGGIDLGQDVERGGVIMNNSYITLFTHEGEKRSQEEEDQLIIGVPIITESNYDSNNYNYSESDFPH